MRCNNDGVVIFKNIYFLILIKCVRVGQMFRSEKRIFVLAFKENTVVAFTLTALGIRYTQKHVTNILFLLLLFRCK